MNAWAAETAPGVPLRIGVYGGAFDPPHLAHRVLAQSAIQQLALDRLLILPTGQAWHKERALTDASHRLAMCLLAFGDLPNTQIDPRETRRNGPSYTADTLAELHREWPDARFFLILGADQLLAFQTWMRWPEVLQRAQLAVANRATHIGEDALDDAHHSADLSSVGVPFVPLDMPLTNISATAVRARFGRPMGRAGAHVALVSPAVASYISQHHLYQNPS
ncbi:MAG: nicotinate (nicotinamide) nucleotide adenylyltransferase [Hydrogenophaga sp.]